MPASNCIFCKIAKGDIPALRVMETAESIAFLDIGPLAPGHVLLIPKQHYESLLDTPADVLASLIKVAPTIARAVTQVTGADGINLLQNSGASSGQVVFHLHFHFIPRRSGDGLGYRWNAGKYAAGEAEAMRERLLLALKS